ncbi:MAG TPA: 30S ribosomal protein S6 [Phycisphaerae bacterium]|nr:30S ribosomal protein S6 [Phycisphaerae bacterium]
MSDNLKLYEGMFLLDAGNSDFHAASEPARAMLDRCEAEVLSIKPWDERRLAYEIRGRRRGLYVLTYFRAHPDRLAELERDCQLDGRILRLLILRRDNLTEEQINEDTPATATARRAAARKAEEDARLAQQPGEEGEGAAAGKEADRTPPAPAGPAPKAAEKSAPPEEPKAAEDKPPAEAAPPAAEAEPDHPVSPEEPPPAEENRQSTETP